MGIGPLVGWLAVTLVLLVVMTRWFGTQLRGLVFLITANPTAALYVYFALLLPGTLTHELSHYAVAKLLGVRTGKLTLGPKPRGSNMVQFGALEYQRPDAVRESLIGLAPLLVGSALVLFLADWRLGLDPGILSGLGDLPGRLDQVMSSPDAWLWIYLITAISNAMLPSEADRRGWQTFGLYVLVIGAILYFAGFLSTPSPQVVALVTRFASALSFAFTLTILLDIVIGGLMWGVATLLGWLLRRRVTYQ